MSQHTWTRHLSEFIDSLCFQILQVIPSSCSRGMFARYACSGTRKKVQEAQRPQAIQSFKQFVIVLAAKITRSTDSIDYVCCASGHFFHVWLTHQSCWAQLRCEMGAGSKLNSAREAETPQSFPIAARVRSRLLQTPSPHVRWVTFRTKLNKLAKLGEAIAISNLKLWMTNSLTDPLTDRGRY